MSNPYAVVLDASVLAKALHRNILLVLASADCFRPIWSDTILSETVEAINKQGGNGKERREQLERAFPGAMADSSYIHLVRKIQLTDENDRHVVAAALQEGADAICSDDKRGFGLSTVETLTADEFIVDTIDVDPVKAIEALASLRRKIRKAKDGREFVELLNERGLVETAAYLEQYSDRL